MNYRNFDFEIKNLVAEQPKTYHRIIRKDAELYQWLVDRCKDFTDYLPEMVYSVIRPTDSPYCASGNKRKFRTINTGWNKCTVIACKACLTETKNRTTRTSMKRYGVENPMQDNTIKQRMINSALSNDSYSKAAKKRKEHYENKYGVDHYWKTTEGQQKRIESMLIKYGVENPSSSEEFQSLKKKNCRDKHGVDHPMQSLEVLTAHKESFFNKHGVINPSQLDWVQEKIRATSQERYGVDHHSKHQPFIDKVKQTSLEKYGETNFNKVKAHSEHNAVIRLENFYENLQFRVPTATPLFSVDQYHGVNSVHRYEWRCNQCSTKFSDTIDDGKIPICPTCYPVVKSRGEEELSAFIVELGITVVRNDRTLISPKEIDIFLPLKNIAFEYNGLYWHSETSGNKHRDYHLKKHRACEEKGIQLIQLNDVEWLTKRPIVESRIRQKLGMSERIAARKCKIIQIESSVANQFHIQNHIQGACPGSIHYGLLYDGMLVSVMSFGKSRYSKTSVYELLRFCTVLGYSVIGGASRLLKQFERDYRFPTLVSYCDLRWNNGNVYTNIGFSLDHVSSPNYWYHKHDGILQSRIRFQKHKLASILTIFDPKLTEWENMKLNGFDRIWDCGNLVFLKN